MSQKVVLFKAGEVPCQGQYSSIDPIALRIGQWAKITNIRTDDATMRVRPPATEFLNKTGLDTDVTVVGWYSSAKVNPIVAVWDASASQVQIWQRVGASYVQRTNGTTRFTTNAPVTFSEVQEGWTSGIPDGPQLMLVAQNGYEAPRVGKVASGAVSTFYNVASLDTLIPDTCTAQPWGNSTWSIADRVAGNLSVSDADVTVAVPTLTNVGTYCQGTFSAATDVGDWFMITMAGSANGTLAGQLQLIYNSSDRGIFERVSLIINVGGVDYYLHHAGTSPSPVYDDVGNGYIAVGFEFRNVRRVSDGVQVTTASLGGLGSTLKFIWTGSLPAASTVLNIFGVMIAGTVPFGTQFAVSLFDADTRQESPGIVCISKFPPTLAEMAGTPVPNVRFGAVEGFTYRYLIRAGGTNVPTGFLLTWADEVGDGIFSLCIDDTRVSTPNTENTGSGAGSLAASGTRIGTYSVTNLDIYEDYSPSAFQIVLPTGDTMLSVNDRLFVAGNLVSGGTDPGKVYFSQKEYPFRFSELPSVIDGTFDATSSGSTKLNSKVTAMATMSASVLGANPVLIWTDRNLFSTDGITATSLSSPRIVAPHGTLSPRSVVTYEDSAFWLDNERQFRSLGGVVGGLGVRRVEDVFTGIAGSDLANVVSFAFRDRLYVAYKPSGASNNTAAMVYDQRTGIWVQDTLNTGLDFCRFGTIRSNGADLMGFITSTGITYEYEGTQTGNEASSAIGVNLWSHAISNSTLTAIRFSHPTIYSDRIASTVWDFSLYSHRLSAFTTGKIDMDYDASEKSWTVGRGSTEADRVGMSDSAVQLRIEGTAPGGAKIYYIAIDREEQGDRKVKRG